MNTLHAILNRFPGGLAGALALHALVIGLLLRGLTAPLALPPQAAEISISLISENREPPRPVMKPAPRPETVSRPVMETARPVITQAGPSPTAVSAPPAPPVPASPAPTRAEAAPVVTPPRFDAAYLSNPAPAYPNLSRRAGEEGKVLLRVQVSAEGTALSVEIHTSSGHPRLDAAARAAVEKWRFVPARQGSQAVAAPVIVPIQFRLNSNPGESS